MQIADTSNYPPLLPLVGRRGRDWVSPYLKILRQWAIGLGLGLGERGEGKEKGGCKWGHYLRIVALFFSFPYGRSEILPYGQSLLGHWGFRLRLR